MRTFLLLTSALLSLAILFSVGPLGLVACFGLCLVSLLVSVQGPAAASTERALRPAVGAETLY